MGKRWILMVGVALGGLALVAAACAPTAEPAATTTTTQPATTKVETVDVAKGQAEAKPLGQTTTTTEPKKTTTTTTTGGASAKPATSVSGIPLSYFEGAKTGGILKTAYSSEGPTFSEWEERGGIAPLVGQPVTNMIIQPRSWGTKEDFLNQAYFEFHPDLATSWEQSADGLQWTFNLRDGVKWPDGRPFTCADTKWSLDAIRTGEGLRRSPQAVQFLAVDRIECPTDLQMVIQMKRPKPGFLDVVGAPYHSIRPAHIYKGNEDKMRKEPNVGTGPFTITQWVPGEKFVFTKKADYWNKPFPYLDGIESVQLATAAQATALRGGRIHFNGAFGFSSGAAETLIKECTTCEIWPRSVVVGMKAVMPNHQRPPWNDPLIKDALSLALDRKKIVGTAFLGWAALPSGGVFFPGSYWAMPEETLKTIPGYDFDHPEENKQRARELLKQAGYGPGELVLPLFFGVYNEEEMPTVIEDYTDVGFKVQQSYNEVGRTYEVFGNGDFDVGLHDFWTAGIDPDVQLYEHFYTGSDRNYNRYSNPEFDRLTDQMSQTVDPELRRQRAWAAAELAMREQAKIDYGTQMYAAVWSNKLKGLIPAVNYLAGYGPYNRHEHVWLTE